MRDQPTNGKHDAAQEAQPLLTTRQGHPVFDNQHQRTVGERGPATLENYHFRLLSRDRESSEQFMYYNRRYHEIKAELALSGIVP